MSNRNDDQDKRPLELPIIKRPVKLKAGIKQDDPAIGSSCSELRDPRFDPRCAGSNDVRHFVRNYSFVDDLRKQELAELERALRKEKDDEKRTKIKLTINRIRNKVIERQNRSKQFDIQHEMKSEGKGKGNKYGNVKKSDIKKNLIVSKYKELKETGKLAKYLERKRKKLIKRDGRAFN